MAEFHDKRTGKVENISNPNSASRKAAQDHRGNPHRSIPKHNSGSSWQSGCKQCDMQEKAGTHPLT